MDNNIDSFFQKFIFGKNILYQLVSYLAARNRNVNVYILNDLDNKKSVTLADEIKDSTDSNIYFDFIKSIDDTSMYQIHFNPELINESKLFIILSEIFDKKNTNINYLKTLMRPLFKDHTLASVTGIS